MIHYTFSLQAAMAAMRERYEQGDGLRDELTELCEIVKSAMLQEHSPTISLHPQAGKAISTDWGKLLNALVYCNHRSQVILTSREVPADLASLRYEDAEPDSELVHIEILTGVAVEDGLRFCSSANSKISWKICSGWQPV